MQRLIDLVVPKAESVYCCSCLSTAVAYKSNTKCICDHNFCGKRFSSYSRNVNCGQLQYRVSPLWLVGFVILYMIIGTADNTSVILMSFKLPYYIQFALYFPTIIYTTCFAIIALLSRESFFLSKALHIQLLWLGLWTTLNGILAQYALPHIPTELSNVLVQIALPATWISAWFMFRWQISCFKILCFIAILGSLLIAVLPALINHVTGTDKIKDVPIVWVLITLASAIPTAFVTTYQERIFKEMKAPTFVALTYYNLYSLIAYILTIPIQMTPIQMGKRLTWPDLWTNQRDAFLCFIGHGQYLDGCHTGATTMILVFSFCYVGMYAIQALLVKVKDSSFVANFTALLTPLTACTLFIPFIAGADVEKLEVNIIISVVLLTLANLVYEKYATESDSDIPNDIIGRIITGTWLNYIVINKSYNFSDKTDDEEQENLLN